MKVHKHNGAGYILCNGKHVMDGRTARSSCAWKNVTCKECLKQNKDQSK